MSGGGKPDPSKAAHGIYVVVDDVDASGCCGASTSADAL
jgi:hypothetical protein